MTINYNGTIKSLRDIVWGVVTDPLSQIEQITLLIFIKLLSEKHNDLERMKSKKLIFTGKFASYHFDSITRLTGHELVDTVRKAIESLYKNPNIEEPIRRLYERSYLQVNDPRVLSLLINGIEKIDIKNIDLGDFYEHLLAVLGTQKEAGQFRTPRHLIKFIVDVVNPQIGERVLDPACGTAGFLTAAFAHIKDTNTSKKAKKAGSYLDKLNLDQKTFLLNKTIYGYDIDPKMIKFAISNLYLHNIKNPNVSQHNTLTSNDGWEEKYDVILTNPPFSTPKGGVKPTDRFTLNSKRTEVLFMDYVIEHLTLNGRAGVIVPEGIIFQSGKAYKELRKWLIENNYLYAVVSLPAGVFNPYSGVKTSILFMDRELARQTDKILFCKVENDGFDLGAQRRPIDKNDLPTALKIIKAFQKDSKKTIQEIYETIVGGKLAVVGLTKVGSQDKLALKDIAQLVSKKKIIESGDYNLSRERYKESALLPLSGWPFVEMSEVCKIGRGFAFKSSDYVKEGILNFRVTNIGDNGKPDLSDSKHLPKDFIKKYEQFRLEPDDFVIVMVGATTGKIGLITKDVLPALLNQNMWKFIPCGQKINKKYLYYLVSSLPLLKQGGARDYLRQSDFLKIKIPLPPFSIQQKIVDELDGYQKIIDGAKQVVENYKPQIKIDPKWKIIELGNLFMETKLGLVKDKSKQSKKYPNPYIKMNNISYDGDLDLLNIVYVEATEGELEKYTLHEGDFIYNTRNAPNLVGKSAVFHGENGKYLYNNNILRIRFKKEVNPDFINYYLNIDSGKEKIKKLVSGTTSVAAIYQKNFATITVPLPSLKIQKKIVGEIEKEKKYIELARETEKLFREKINKIIQKVWV